VESTEEVEDRTCNEALQHQESATSDELRGAPVLNARELDSIQFRSTSSLVPASAISSRTIEVDRLNLAGVTMHIQGDRPATDFAILNGGKRAGRCVDNCGEDRSAVGTNDA
jgi:hypothetical protein